MTGLPAVRRVAPLFTAQALWVGATTSSQVLASLIAAQLGYEALAGLPSTFTTFAAALSAYPFGRLMARRGWRFGLSAAYLTGALGAAVGFVGAIRADFALFLLGCVLIGLGRGGSEQGRYAAASLVPPERRGSALSLLLFMSVIGSALAALFSPLLDRLSTQYGTSSEILAWLLAAALMLLGTLSVLAWRAPPGAPPTAPPKAGRVRAPRWDNSVRVAALSLAAAQGVMVTLMVLTPLRAHHIGMPHSGIAALLSVHFLGMFGLAWLVGPVIDRFGPRKGLIGGSALFVIAAALLPLTGGVTLAASLFCLGLAWNLCYIAGSALLGGRREVQGSVDALAYLSAGVGALGGSLIVAHAGFGVLAVTGAALGLLPGLAALRLARTTPAAAGA